MQQVGYTKREILTYTKARNRLLGRCRCGTLPIEGETARGEPYRTCARCLSKDRAYRARRRAAWKAIPRAVRFGITGMPFTPPDRIPPAPGVIRLYQRHVAERVRPEPGPAPTLTDRQAAFVCVYAESGNGERAALAAGYGVLSVSRGGRAAAVAACRLLKRADIRDAIATAKEAVKREALKAAVRAEIARRESRIAALTPLAAMRGPQSGAVPVWRAGGHGTCELRPLPAPASGLPSRQSGAGAAIAAVAIRSASGAVEGGSADACVMGVCSLARSGGEAAAALSGARCGLRRSQSRPVVHASALATGEPRSMHESEAVQRIPSTRRPIANMRCAPGAHKSLSKPTMRRTFALINPIANFTILVSRAARSAFVATCSPTASRTVFTMAVACASSRAASRSAVTAA